MAKVPVHNGLKPALAALVARRRQRRVDGPLVYEVVDGRTSKTFAVRLLDPTTEQPYSPRHALAGSVQFRPTRRGTQLGVRRLEGTSVTRAPEPSDQMNRCSHCTTGTLVQHDDHLDCTNQNCSYNACPDTAQAAAEGTVAAGDGDAGDGADNDEHATHPGAEATPGPTGDAPATGAPGSEAASG